MMCKKHGKLIVRLDEFVGCVDCWKEAMKDTEYEPGIK